MSIASAARTLRASVWGVGSGVGCGVTVRVEDWGVGSGVWGVGCEV